MGSRLGCDDQDLAQEVNVCIADLVSAGDDNAELLRRWLVVDWLVRAVAPRWLRSVGLQPHATSLRELPVLGLPHALGNAAPTVEAAAEAARSRSEQAWEALVDHAQASAGCPGASAVWEALTDGQGLRSVPCGASSCPLHAPSAFLQIRREAL